MTIQQKWKNGIFPKNGQFFQKTGNFSKNFLEIVLDPLTWRHKHGKSTNKCND